MLAVVPLGPGLTLGILLTMRSFVLLEQAGPVALIVGLIFLAFGGSAYFVRQRVSRRDSRVR